MSKNINLTQGKVAIVDDSDYERLSKFKWSAARRGRPGGREIWYAARVVEGKMILMHREIVGAARGEKVDHENRNGLDNRRSNLRSCSQAQNSLNRSGNVAGQKTSEFKGVYWQKDIGRWRAKFGAKYLGTFTEEIAAAAAYDAAAKVADPHFAYLNLQ